MKKGTECVYSELGKVICKRLIDLEKTTKWLADEIGVHPLTVSQYIKGSCAPSTKRLYKIATVLSIDVENLICVVLKEQNKEAS